jgi:hypothetical protein
MNHIQWLRLSANQHRNERDIYSQSPDQLNGQSRLLPSHFLGFHPAALLVGGNSPPEQKYQEEKRPQNKKPES